MFLFYKTFFFLYVGVSFSTLALITYAHIKSDHIVLQRGGDQDVTLRIVWQKMSPTTVS